jgi:hypothetical protein
MYIRRISTQFVSVDIIFVMYLTVDSSPCLCSSVAYFSVYIDFRVC